MRAIERAVVFGATGAAGLVVARELLRRGVAVRVVARHRRQLEARFQGTEAEIWTLDAIDADAAAGAIDGCDTVFNGVGLPLRQFPMHMQITNALLQAGKGDVRHVHLTNYWGVAPAIGAISQSTPARPSTSILDILIEQEQAVREAGGCVVMLPDLYGPELRMSFLNDSIGVIMARRVLMVPCDPSVRREFAFAPDLGAPIVELASHGEAFGRRWVIGGAEAAAPTELLEKAAAIAGARLKLRRIGRVAMRIAGLFNSELRQYAPLRPIYNAPAVFDDEATRRLIGDWARTNYDDGLRRTIEWMKSRQR